MPEGEEMFQYHGYSGPCPVPASPPATGKECPFCKHDPCTCPMLDCRALGDNDLMRVPASPRAEPPEQYRQILEKLCPDCYLAVSSVIAGGP